MITNNQAMSGFCAEEQVRPTESETNEKYENIDADFMDKVLIPYRDHCKYLRTAKFIRGDNEYGTIQGEFSIKDSCYIDDTGHFNAVEFNICYNQIAYLHLGYCIKHRLIPELNVFTIEKFYRQQLSHFLIANISSSYAAELNAKSFYGGFGINMIRKRGGCTFVKTFCHFWDQNKGRSKGEVMLAVRDPD